jgi:hypothetical protein
MPSTASLIQIRIIGPTDQANQMISNAAEHARRQFGTTATYRSQIRSAHRIGYVRAYLTVTRKETHDDSNDG